MFATTSFGDICLISTVTLGLVLLFLIWCAVKAARSSAGRAFGQGFLNGLLLGAKR
jgi:hypothetical protein